MRKPRGLVHGLSSLIATIEVAFDKAEFVSGEDYGRHLDMGLLRDLRRQAVEHVRDSNPSVQCAWCNGRGCRVCHATGWVPRSVADRAPRSLRGAG